MGVEVAIGQVPKFVGIKIRKNLAEILEILNCYANLRNNGRTFIYKIQKIQKRARNSARYHFGDENTRLLSLLQAVAVAVGFDRLR